MKLLASERAVLQKALPGFDEHLAELGVAAAEDPDRGVVEDFRAAGGGNLLVPAEFGGAGLGCLDGVRIQRAVGSRAPSLAIASTMHHYKVAWLAREPERTVTRTALDMIVSERRLIASCGAEGTGAGLFTPGIRVEPAEDGLVVSGTKRPCSLVRSMGLLSMLLKGPDGSPYEGQLVNVVVRAEQPGVRVEGFWRSRILRASQSDAVVLEGVEVPHGMVIPLGDPACAAPRIVSNLIWFELLATASYLGMATGQIEELYLGGRGKPDDRVAALAPLETVFAALEGLAAQVDAGRCDDDLLGRCLLVRYSAQRAIAEATDTALVLRGGLAFAADAHPVDVLAASRALAFHPPSEISMREPLDAWLRGEALRLL